MKLNGDQKYLQTTKQESPFGLIKKKNLKIHFHLNTIKIQIE